MAEGLSNRVVNLAVIIVFVLLIVWFIVGYLGTTNPNSQVLTQYGLNNTANSLNKTVQQFTNFSTSASSSLNSSIPTPLVSIFLIFQEAFTIPQAVLSLVVNSIIIIPSIVFPALGGTALGQALGLGLAMMTGILTITTIFLIIKAIRSGETER